MFFLGAIVGAVTSTISSVAGALGSLGPVISGAIAKVSPVLAKIAGPVLDMAKIVVKVVCEAVVNLINEVAQYLGVVPENMDADELGARAMEHPEIKPEDFETTEEYIKELSEAEFDKEKFDKLSPAQKAACTAVGSGLEVKAISEKMQMNIPVDFYVNGARGGMDAQNVVGLLNGMKNNAINDAGLFNNYLDGKLSDKDAPAMQAAISDFESQGGMTVSEIQDNIDNNILENPEQAK